MGCSQNDRVRRLDFAPLPVLVCLDACCAKSRRLADDGVIGMKDIDRQCGDQKVELCDPGSIKLDCNLGPRDRADGDIVVILNFVRRFRDAV